MMQSQKGGLLPAAPARKRSLTNLVLAGAFLLCGAFLLSRENALSLSASRADCTPPRSPNTTQIYLGNGCFWERMWAYYQLEIGGSFGRPGPNITSKVGYAGGSRPKTPAGEVPAVCYADSAYRDYAALGHAEVTRVLLDDASAQKQLSALARDFFDSFQGPAGKRFRPDPQDMGTPYRSLVGLPGGLNSPLYPTFAAANTHGMDLKPGRGGDADEPNTVWVMDSADFPYWDGEVYHQFHLNFFDSEGMPYPDSYVDGLWRAQQASCRIFTTGCPEHAHRPFFFG